MRRPLEEEEALDRQLGLPRRVERLDGAKTGGTDGASGAGTPAERGLHRREVKPEWPRVAQLSLLGPPPTQVPWGRDRRRASPQVGSTAATPIPP